MFDNLMIFCLYLQDRSLDFQELCAVYAVTGKICVLLHFSFLALPEPFQRITCNIVFIHAIVMTSFYRQCIKVYC